MFLFNGENEQLDIQSKSGDLARCMFVMFSMAIRGDGQAPAPRPNGGHENCDT